MTTADEVVPLVPYVPHPEAKAGACVLDQVRTFLGRFIAYPTEWAADAHTLWIAHTHAVDAFENTPRIGFISPEPGSGKSRAMEMTEALVPRPVLSVNASTAYIFRKISDEAGLPTLLLDEVDAIFSGGKSDSSEDLRGLLNSGYRAGATAGRAAIRGKEIVTEEWPSYCAVALAGLNQLPDTLMTRSVVVRMKRRRHNQKVEPYRRRVNGTEADHLNIMLAEWVESVRGELESSWPDLPEGVEDRDADIWEPLIAVGDAAGGHWIETSRVAAVAAITESKSKPASLGVQLLADVRKVLGDLDRISTTDLLDALHDLDTAPWSSLRGEPIDARFLARTLDKYEISPSKIRIGVGTVRGYHRHDFADAWERYCPDVPDVPHVPDFDPNGSGPSSSSTWEGDSVILNKEDSILNKEDFESNHSGIHSPVPPGAEHAEQAEHDPGCCAHGVTIGARCTKCGGKAVAA